MKKVLVWLFWFFIKLVMVIVIGTGVVIAGYFVGEKWAYNHLPTNIDQRELRDLYINYKDSHAQWYTPELIFYVRNEMLIVESKRNVPSDIDCKIDMDTCGLLKDVQIHWEHTYNTYHSNGRAPYVLFRNLKHETIRIINNNSSI